MSAATGRPARISIVTPSLNQGRYIGETVESVLRQDYPDLEHIVVDGGSTDGTLEVLARYRHLRVVSEPDRGHADALNKGFRMASGAICGFVNSDDLLMPGALQRVAREIDPAAGRHVVMGRCRFIDEAGRFTGIEHPSAFESHRRVLAIWKGHTIPQPAVFWTPEVWRACGPMDEGVRSAWIDYDFFCRVSRAFRFHVVDQVLAAYRLHDTSKTGQRSEAERLEESIAISRRYWGGALSPSAWSLGLSLRAHRFDRVGRGRRWLREASEAWAQGRALPAAGRMVAGAAFAPEVVFFVAVYPRLRARLRKVGAGMLDRLAASEPMPPQTQAYLGYTDPWQDRWVGPRLVREVEADAPARFLRVAGWTDLTHIGRALVLTVAVDDTPIGEVRVKRSGAFSHDIPLPRGIAAGAHRVDVAASDWYVPHRILRNGDFRPLAWRMDELSFGAAPP